MNMPQEEPQNQQEDKSQARLDYEEGLEHQKNEELTLAANMYHNALIGYEQDNDQHGIANAAARLGDICHRNQDYDKALEHYERAYNICQQETDHSSIFTLEQKLARIYLEKEDYQEALRRYVEIMDEFEALRNPRGVVNTLETLAHIYLKLGKKENAAEAYKVAASIHKNFKHIDAADELKQKAEEIKNH